MGTDDYEPILRPVTKKYDEDFKYIIEEKKDPLTELERLPQNEELDLRYGKSCPNLNMMPVRNIQARLAQRELGIATGVPSSLIERVADALYSLRDPNSPQKSYTPEQIRDYYRFAEALEAQTSLIRVRKKIHMPCAPLDSDDDVDAACLGHR